MARRLLWTALALSAEGATSLVAHIDARQQWAFEVVLQARLNVMPELGALFIRGEVGGLMPYLPAGHTCSPVDTGFVAGLCPGGYLRGGPCRTGHAP